MVLHLSKYIPYPNVLNSTIVCSSSIVYQWLGSRYQGNWGFGHSWQVGDSSAWALGYLNYNKGDTRVY